jgi:hypothetical protein
LDKGTIEKVVRLSAKDKSEVELFSRELTKELSKSNSLKIPILLSMLKKELDGSEEA